LRKSGIWIFELRDILVISHGTRARIIFGTTRVSRYKILCKNLVK
jgi:hypothetical protein